MKGTEFLLGIIGLNRVERMTVASVCSLTHSRPRGYTVLSQERSADADITLVDADDAGARAVWETSPACLSDKPALMISRDPAMVGRQPYALPRTNFAARLIRILDQITIREFKFVPEIVVSDTNVLDASLGLNAPASKHASANAPHSLLRALVVDDSVVLRTKMRTLLELHGMRVDLAEDAEQGLASLRVNQYQIVFLDVVLPGMDGYSACRQMKGAHKNAPPIIMLTSRDSPFDKIRGVMAGCNRYLTKPIAVDALHKVLSEFVPALTHRAQRADSDAVLIQLRGQ